MKRSLLINVCTPLLVGAIFYYLFCPDVYFVRWLDSLSKMSIHFTLDGENLILQNIRFYLLDFLWAYALMVVSLQIMKTADVRPLLAVVIIFEVIVEALQIIPAITGTFDICDILVEILANVLVVKINLRRNKNEKN